MHTKTIFINWSLKFVFRILSMLMKLELWSVEKMVRGEKLYCVYNIRGGVNSCLGRST